MEFTEILTLIGAGFIGASLNAIVGGGAFVAFPALIFLGVPPIQANATMTVALWPGTLASLWAQRKELMLHTRMLPLFIPLSLLGGGIGAIIVISLSNENFAQIVPYMLLVATLLFTFRHQFIGFVKSFSGRANNKSILHWSMLAIPQLLISIYGGFFGAGMGIMFLAFLGILGIHNMHEANSVRNCSTACINSVATAVFIISGKVIWSHMILMCFGALLGGYICALYARKFSSEQVRKFVIVIAWGMTVYFFWKTL
jgi:uncharacterized membrane protein YfcA